MKMYSNTISVHSNFRRKEPLYLFIQALFLTLTDTGFRDLQFSYYFQQKISQAPRWGHSVSEWQLTCEVRVENAIPPPSPRLERLLYSPPQVPEGEEDRVGGVEVSLHTSGLARAASPGLDLGLLPWSVKQKYDPSKSLRWPSGLVSLEVHVNYHSDTKRPHRGAWDSFCWK